MKHLCTLWVYMYCVRGSNAKRKRKKCDRVGSVLRFCGRAQGRNRESGSGKRKEKLIWRQVLGADSLLLWQEKHVFSRLENLHIDTQRFTFPLLYKKGNAALFVVVLMVLWAVGCGPARLAY